MASTVVLPVVDTATVNGVAVGPRNTVSLGSSPCKFQNTSACKMSFIVTGGTVTTIEMSKDDSTYDVVGLLAGQQILAPGDWMRITYVLAPSVTYTPI